MNIKKPILGFLIFLVHLFFYVSMYFFLFFGEVNLFYYFLCFIWVLSICTHIYFKECLITKVEKNLWEAEKWDGLWTPIFSLLDKNNIEVRENLKNNIFICFAIFVFIFLIVRIVFN